MNMASDENLLVIPQEGWRSTRVYYYCPECDDVFGIPKGDSPVCARCGQGGCRDIFTEIVERVSTVWDFYEAMRVKDGPFGRFREADSPHPYTLNANYHAIQARLSLVRYGFEEPYTPEQVRE